MSSKPRNIRKLANTCNTCLSQESNAEPPNLEAQRTNININSLFIHLGIIKIFQIFLQLVVNMN